MGKSDGIPYDISIQSSKGADNKGIGFAYFHLYEGDCFGGGGVQFCQRNELVVNTIVEHQEHGRVVGVVLDPKETFGGIVGFSILHAWGGDEAFVLLSVGGETDPSVEEHFQFAPYFAQVIRLGVLKQSFDEGKHPRGDAREAPYVSVSCLGYDGRDFLHPVLEEEGFFGGNSYGTAQAGHLFDED